MSRVAVLASSGLFLVLLSAVTAICPNGTHPPEFGPPYICFPGPDGCPPGTARKVTEMLPGTFVIECGSCAPGFTTYGYDASICKRIGYPCPEGYRQTSNGDCLRCLKCERFDKGLERCVACPTGTGAVPGLSLWCAPCAHIVNHNLTNAGCHSSFLSFAPQGFNCPLGSRLLYRDAWNQPICEKCPRGFYSNETNPSQCTRCPALTIAPNVGAERCEPCPQGKILGSGRYSDICVLADTGCPEDTEPAQVNGEHICRSKTCGNGDNSIDAVIGRQCGPCGTLSFGAQYLVTEGPFSGRCEYCPLDALSDGLECTACPSGQVRTVENQCGCNGPLALKRGVDDNGNCVPCPKGSYGAPGPDGENVCTKCSPGSGYFEQTEDRLLGCYISGRCIPFTNQCIACGQGTVSTEPGSLTCEPCPEGTFTYGQGEPRCFREGEPSALTPFNDPFGNPFSS